MNTPATSPKSDNSDFYLEAGTLRSGLLIAACYEAVQIIQDIVTQAPQLNFIINSTALVFLASLWIAAKNNTSNIFALGAVMHLLLLPLFVYFWINYNGVAGSVPYFLLLYFCLIIFTQQGALRFLFLGLYSLMTLYLIAFPDLFKTNRFDLNNPEEIFSLSIDCFLAALLLSVFFVRLKKRFEEYRSEVTAQNIALETHQITFLEQNILIEEQKEKIEQFNRNLHLRVLQRTEEVQSRNKMLAEYAFINAHVLRGPLSRVMGLLNLMLLEERTRDPEKVKQVRHAAEEMDSIIRKINDVLH